MIKHMNEYEEFSKTATELDKKVLRLLWVGIKGKMKLLRHQDRVEMAKQSLF